MFTGQRGPTNPSASDPFSSQSQQKASPTEKKAKYDPTIENILKSIGFDFEMSKRMQEKANPTPFKPKEEMQYGIDTVGVYDVDGVVQDDDTGCKLGTLLGIGFCLSLLSSWYEDSLS
jgi:hypothetical protein